LIRGVPIGGGISLDKGGAVIRGVPIGGGISLDKGGADRRGDLP